MSQYNTALVDDMIAGGSVATDESNDELYPRVAAGDAAAREEMITSNMSLVVNKVDSYIGEYPNLGHLRDDLISEGFLGLVTAVNKMVAAGPKDNPNPTGYMSYWIMYHIGLTVDREDANGASHGTIWTYRSQGKELARQVPMPVLEDDKSDADLPPWAANSGSDQIVDPMSMVDLRDLIEACCESEQDQVIVDLRELGHSDKYIADRLEQPVSTTYMMRRAIYTRFLQKSGLKGEV